ncbi:SOH1-domain-containing protein [Suillus spraguei]|nr:SOH1-domain-containing protein [Suillus spraguei]
MASEPAQSPQATTEDPRATNRDKFELELEFVQSLANPYYLHSLAQQNILDQPAFINYLQYLTYWKEKDYARFIQFLPTRTAPSRLAPARQFRSEMKKDEWRDILNQKQYDHWRTWRDYPGISTTGATPTDPQETGVQSSH